jgi:AraC-like DNA-binding protein
LLVYERIFNLHDVMLLMTATLSLLLALPVFYRRRRQPVLLLLAAFVLSQGLIALYYLFLYAAPLRPSTLGLLQPFQIMPLVILYTAQGMLLYWYSCTMGGLAIRIGKRDLSLFVYLCLVPILLLGFLWWSGMWIKGYDGVLLGMPPLVASIVYGILAWITLARHERQIREQYSNIDDKKLLWLGYCAVGFVGIWAVRLVGHVAGFSGNVALAEMLSTWANAPAMILIGWMVILGLGQERSPVADTIDDGESAERPKLANPETIRRLEDLMVRVKVYQDPDLNREGLADSLGVSPRSLSSLVNGHFGMTFYEFVNEYRVREAKERLANAANANLTIQRVFELAGFNSKSTFNTLFKQATGMTPSEYRRTARLSAKPSRR